MKQFLIVILIFLCFKSYSQDENQIDATFNYKNNAQFELFGHVGSYTLIYERIILNSKVFKTSMQFGFSHYRLRYFYYYQIPGSKPRGHEISFPVLVNEIYSFNNHHLEIGFGGNFRFSFMSSENSLNPNPFYLELLGRGGYRYQKPDGRMVFRAAYTPIYLPIVESWFSKFGLSCGYCF